MLVAVVSKKGGVGKTTTAVNLAAGLAARGQRTLLVDLDPQASASLSIGIPRERLAPSSSDLLLGDAEVVDVLRHTRFEHLDLITSSADLVNADRELAVLRRPEERLRSKLEPVRDRYDFILCDCPPGLSTLPASALVAADGFVVPITPHFLAIEGLRNFLQAVDRLGIRHRLGLRCVGVVLTVVDYRTKVTRVNVQRLREEFGGRVFAVEVRTAIKLAEAPALGQSIFEYAPNTPAAASMRNLCDEFQLRAERLRAEPRERENVTPMESSLKFERKHWVPGTRAVRS
ncbi:MAG: ParA family protein [Acidobacteria bacterium]|nr:MAG: ParA family protein [Acidobacteriota bacterium]REK01012.1 MAG: ParA family protein [Acidobacteriota bacterium]